MKQARKNWFVCWNSQETFDIEKSVGCCVCSVKFGGDVLSRVVFVWFNSTYLFIYFTFDLYFGSILLSQAHTSIPQLFNPSHLFLKFAKVSNPFLIFYVFCMITIIKFRFTTILFQPHCHFQSLIYTIRIFNYQGTSSPSLRFHEGTSRRRVCFDLLCISFTHKNTF